MKAFLEALARRVGYRRSTAQSRGAQPGELISATLGITPEAYVVIDAYFGAYAHAVHSQSLTQADENAARATAVDDSRN